MSDDILGDRRRAWRIMICGEGRDEPLQVSRVCLGELASYCFATTSTAATDAMQMAINEGRRQVWLFVQSRLVEPVVSEDE